MDEKKFISVILPLKLEWEPCYYVRCTNDSQVKVGDRIRLTFAGRNYVAVVSEVGIKPSMDTAKIKEAVRDGVTVESVSVSEIEFWRQIAEYYLCTVGEVYKAAYPAGKVNMEEALAARRQKEIERHLRELTAAKERVNRISGRISKLQERMDAKSRQIEKAVKEETRLRYVAELDRFAENLERMIRERDGLIGKFPVDMKRNGADITGDVGSCPQSLEEDYVQCSSVGSESLGFSGRTGADNDVLKDGGIVLTRAQEEAYHQIVDGFSEGKPVMLHGVTGAGKTEIYLKLAQDAISSGHSVLYLVPEIALSLQLEDRLREHFHEKLYVFHSGQTAVQKRDTARMIKNSASSPYILLGTRSALFLPHNNLGLIVVDEEHDSSYKQESPAPRYNGRDAALILARIMTGQQTHYGAVDRRNRPEGQLEVQDSETRCNVVLGSATPSLEEVYNCIVGKHRLVELTERYHGADDADVEILDTRAERRKKGMVGSFSRKLIYRINSVLEEGGQVLILRSRRAWSSSMQCSQCGEIVRCPHCNVSLSLHGKPEDAAVSGSRKFVCHYCGYSRTYKDECPKCGSPLVPLGTGTQRIEEEVMKLFPQAKVARLDSDSAKNKVYQRNVIRDFSRGNIDILVGTQIVAKGFDFVNLRLVAVIAADSLLGMQDFRADEKALQLLEQLRGRCGRRRQKGLFVIQTSQPEHPIYQRIGHNETDCFNENLLQERKEFGFPPYFRIIEIQVKDRVETRAADVASRLANALRSSLSPFCGTGECMVTGPYTPMPDKLADNYLRMIRVSLRKNRNLVVCKGILREVVRQVERQTESLVVINVDPS